MSFAAEWPRPGRRALWNRVLHFLEGLLADLLIAAFVDGTWLHRLWHCHRRPDRSFALRGRQFHLCARCTGLVVGMVTSPLLISLNVALLFWATTLSVTVLVIDGLAQYAGWGNSTNPRRFATGFLGGAFLLAMILNLVWRFVTHG